MAGNTSREIPVGVTLKGHDQSGPVLAGLRKLGLEARSASVSMRGLRDVSTGLLKGLGYGIAGIGAAGAGLAIAAKEVFGFVDRWATAMDARAKTARALRVDVGALEAWEYAAGRSGMAAEDLRGSLFALDRAVGLLAMRRGKGYAILSSVVGGKELITRLKEAPDAIARLRVALDAVRRTSPQYRAAILQAMGLGPEALRLVSVSAQELDRLLERRSRYGLVSRAGAESAEAWSDALEDLRAAWDGLRSVAVPEIIRVAVPQMQAFGEWIASNREKLSGFIAEFGRRVVEAASGVLRAVQDIVAALDTVERYRRAWNTGGAVGEMRRRGIRVLSKAEATNTDAYGAIAAMREQGYITDADIEEARREATRGLTPYASGGLRSVGQRTADESEVLRRAADLLARRAMERGAITIQVSAAPGTRAEVVRAEGVDVQPAGSIPLLGGVR